MEGGKSLINCGDLTKPATVLIEKISDAVGGLFKPWQIRRVAKAEADVDRIRALSQIETQIQVTELTQRAFGRFLAEETKKQDNMESITSKAIPLLEADSKPQEIDDDWITNFFDKCRLISDEEMQTIWAKILAGEANTPGKFSKRTVNFLGSLDKSDADLFTNLCGFGWIIGEVVRLIYDLQLPLYLQYGLNYNSIKHLDDIGLLSFNSLTGYKKMGYTNFTMIIYYGTPLIIEFSKYGYNELDIGYVLLSKVGQELYSICSHKPVPTFLDYVVNRLISKNLKLSSPIVNIVNTSS